MGTATFQKGACVNIGGNLFRLLKMIDSSTWIIEEERTGRPREIQDAELRDLYATGKLKFNQVGVGVLSEHDFISSYHLNEKELDVARSRLMYVKAVLGEKSIRQMESKISELNYVELGFEAHPSLRTVRRWRKKYIESGEDLISLSTKLHKSGNKKSRYSESLNLIVNDAIEEKYLTLERLSIQDVLDEVEYKVRRHNEFCLDSEKLKVPGFRFINRKIDNVSEFDKVSARHGHAAAMKKFRHSKASPATLFPLERAEIDHTRMDLFVIDDEIGMPLGRPWLTVCLDDFSRSILGLNLSFEPPSYRTVAACLKKAFLPKSDSSLEAAETDGSWLQHGVMRELVVDNGLEFHSKSLENACYSLGITISYNPRKTPWYKGKVERFQGTLNRGVSHKAPGSSFSNIFEKEDYDPVKHAVVRYSELKKIVNKWVVDFYHMKPHSSLQISPLQLWKNSISLAEIPLPRSPEFINALLGRSDSRSLDFKGVQIDYIFYNSLELADLRKKYGEKLTVDVKIDDSDLGEIVVINPKDKSLIRVQALCFEYAEGLSRWQHKVIRRYAKNKMMEDDPRSWIDAKHDIAELINSELIINKRKANTKVARYKNSGAKDQIKNVVPIKNKKSENNKSQKMYTDLGIGVDTSFEVSERSKPDETEI